MNESSLERFIDSWHNTVMEGAITPKPSQETNPGPISTTTSKLTMQKISSFFTSTPKSDQSKRNRSPSTRDGPNKLLCDQSTPSDHHMSDESHMLAQQADGFDISGSVVATMDEFQRSLVNSVETCKRDLLGHIDKLKHRVEECETSLADQDTRIEELEKENTVIKARNNVTEGRLIRCEHFLERIADDVLSLQTRSMKDNIVFYNIPEVHAENPTETILKFLSKEMNFGEDIQTNHILRCHRMGQFQRNNTYPRAIVTQFDPRICDIIMRHAYRLKGKNYRISVQVPREVDERRKLLNVK